MKLLHRHTLFFPSLLYLFLCFACQNKEAPLDQEWAVTEAAQELEAELEADAKNLTDSLLPEKASLHFGYPPVKNIRSQEDMQWLLYDEPLMLYIETDDFRTEHAEFE